MGLVPLPKKRPPRGAAAIAVAEMMAAVAPVGGLNYRDPIAFADLKDAHILKNMWPRPFGCELRAGYRRHYDSLLSPVVTLMAYHARDVDDEILIPGAKLFAACEDENIYDVTNSGETGLPSTPSLEMPGQINKGRLSWTNFSTAGTVYLCVVGAGGGYWTYDVMGGWVNHPIGVAAGEITFPVGDDTVPEDFDFVIVFKNRLWFIKDGTGTAYYLPVNVIAGAVEVFEFGPLLIHGGELEALATWSATSGEGMNDKLVAYSSQGDVMIYEGEDPGDAEKWNLSARWYLGRPPVGRRFMGRYGGDLYVVSEKGITSLSDMIRISEPQGELLKTHGKISHNMGNAVRATRDAPGWEIRYLESHQIVMINAPNGAMPDPDSQYVMEINSKGWATSVGMPIRTSELFEGELYFGDENGIVYKAFGEDTDGVLVNGTPGVDIEGELQTVWHAPGKDPVRLKNMQQVKTFFIAPIAPSVLVQTNMEWNISPSPGSPAYVGIDAALWDSAIWDTARWVGQQNTYQAWTGVTGIGVFVSLRMRVRGQPGTTFTNWILIFTKGGIM